jgi:hypothetical protein
MLALLPVLLLGCADPSEQMKEGVTYRNPPDPGPQSGERGTVIISEVLWSGAVRGTGADAKWDPTDVFVEVRNQSNTPLDLEGWRIQQAGSTNAEYRIPAGGPTVDVGGHAFIAAKDSGCFPDPDWVIPTLAFVQDQPFELVLRDADERLIEPIGDEEMPPFAGGYDTVSSRSMERVELMFGGEGTLPHIWHFYTRMPVDVPNDDRIDPECREHTFASPGRANSPDYSGAYAAGSLD